MLVLWCLCVACVNPAPLVGPTLEVGRGALWSSGRSNCDPSCEDRRHVKPYSAVELADIAIEFARAQDCECGYAVTVATRWKSEEVHAQLVAQPVVRACTAGKSTAELQAMRAASTRPGEVSDCIDGYRPAR